MLQRKLRFSNRWMFNKVMMEEPICKHVIQAILEVEVERIDYLNSEQTIEPDPGSRGVRMDVYVREQDGGRVCDFEMLACAEPLLGKRFRYYQAALDAKELPKGVDYDQLPESFIVFLCDMDPFGYNLPIYHMERSCMEVPELSLADQSHWLVLNARGWEALDDGDLLDLLRYVQTGKAVGSLSQEIDQVVARANKDRKWVDRVFSISTIEENDARRRRIELRQARAEGIEQGIEQGEQRFAALASTLIGLGRIDDLQRATNDYGAREELFQEFSL